MNFAAILEAAPSIPQPGWVGAALGSAGRPHLAAAARPLPQATGVRARAGLTGQRRMRVDQLAEMYRQMEAKKEEKLPAAALKPVPQAAVRTPVRATPIRAVAKVLLAPPLQRAGPTTVVSRGSEVLQKLQEEQERIKRKEEGRARQEEARKEEKESRRRQEEERIKREEEESKRQEEQSKAAPEAAKKEEASKSRALQALRRTLQQKVEQRKFITQPSVVGKTKEELLVEAEDLFRKIDADAERGELLSVAIFVHALKSCKYFVCAYVDRACFLGTTLLFSGSLGGSRGDSVW